MSPGNTQKSSLPFKGKARVGWDGTSNELLAKRSRYRIAVNQ